MSWLIPWFITCFVSWFGGDTQLSLPPLIPNDTPPNGLAADQNASLTHSNPPVDALTGGDIVRVDLLITNRCVAPDGFPRVAVLAGFQGKQPTLPGPVISGMKGDRFLINVANNLFDNSMFTGTTVHWHGILQRHSSQMDGTAYVTQCPISPGESFLYNFTGGDQVGTFWYHSHYQVQYCDGLRGPLIIRHPNDPYKYLYDFDSDSEIITLMDWYHYPSPETPRQVWADSVLINGVGCYVPDCRSPEDCPRPKDCPPPATFVVEEGKRYRFRLLNMACKPSYNFSIDGHTMTVIEADGNYVEPYTVDSIEIHAAQRYSFILNADRPPTDYWIRANSSQPMANAISTAILRYNSNSKADPKTNGETKNPLNESLLRSLYEPDPRLLKPDPDHRVNVAMYKDNWTDYNFWINGVQYESPSVPVLLQIMSGKLSSKIEPQKSVYLLPKDQVVEVTFRRGDTPGRPHPFHLHGHHFVVLKSADTYNESDSWNFDKPVTRDTVSTGRATDSDGVTIRFITDNPGPWILHCHNEWHLYTGMAIIFVEDYASILAEQADGETHTCTYTNPSETFTLPPPNATPGPHTPTTTVTACKATPTSDSV